MIVRLRVISDTKVNIYLFARFYQMLMSASMTLLERPQSEELCNSANKRRLFHEVKDAKSRNIVIFGETGTGKSSLINMLSDSDVAMVSNGALGCTFGSTGHTVEIDGARYTLWDTAGLNEGETGHVPADQALRNLRDLVHLKLRDGISLLVYCIRGTRYRDILKVNYDIFADIICQGEIPVVIVITGLENETRMEDWWDENKSDFAEPRFHFRGHVCITATRGKKDKEGVYTFEEEYKQSRIAIRSLIKEQCPDKVWAADSDQWVNRITQRIAEYYDQHNRHSQTYQGNYVGIMAPHAIMVAIDSWKYFRNFLRKIFRVLSFQEPLREDRN